MEHYVCQNAYVRFSNGACQSLQLAWADIADSHKNDPAMATVAEQFRTISEFATGGAAVGVDAEYLEPPFDQLPVKHAWLIVMRELMVDITKRGRVSRRMDVKWSEQQRVDWCDRLKKLETALEVQL